MRGIDKLIRGVGILAMMAGMGGLAAANSTGASVVGNWSLHDRGQGCWAGGNLLSDGTGNGGGNCSVSDANGQSIASIKPVSWAFTDPSDTAVNLCADFTAKKGDIFGPPGTVSLNCITVPVGTDKPVVLPGDTYGKVTIK
jgi:hypothetical protein